LNHGSFGARPRAVFEAYQNWQLELEREPIEFLGRRFYDLMRDARKSLAGYVGADADDLVYVPNATTGLNIVARSLPLQPGDEVLTTDHEYGALERTWRFMCAKRGANYINHALPYPLTSADEIVESLWARVTPRTRVLFLSHITSPTALILPIAKLIRRARAAGIITVVDGAHAPGQIPLNLDALGVDYYSGNCHKWMNAPVGAAFLYARRQMQLLLEPLVISWGWQSETPGTSRFVDEQEWQGTRDVAAYLSVPAAIQFMAEHDWTRVQRECHQLACYARSVMGDLTGIQPLTPESPDWYAQMVSIPLPAYDAKLLQARLFDEYSIEVPIVTWNGRQFVRVSVQGYNTQVELDTLTSALATLLPQGRTPETESGRS
jgi:isopenicillin-N epimerase